MKTTENPNPEASQGRESSDDHWKVVLLGGDQAEADYFIGEAGSRGVQMEYFDSTLSMGFLGKFREYDAAIVHEDLKPLTAMELAEYLEKLFESLPMVVLKNEGVKRDEVRVPEETSSANGVLTYYSKAEEPSLVLGKIIETLSSPKARELRAVK